MVKITTPVLFMVFNRPEKTRQVFEVIKNVKPTKLYISADAPRVNVKDDVERCIKVKEIVQNIDWDCEVKYLFHKDNLGCSLAGITAWNWLFTFEDEMIFIEDDGLVSDSFFLYCQDLLEKYRENKQVAYIGGVNYGLKFGQFSYFFSRPPAATYSMATWKRVHDLYEPKIESFHENKCLAKFKETFINDITYRCFIDSCNFFLKNGGNTYDLQMNYLVHKYDMYSVYPNLNLSSNIGLDFGGANNNISPNSDFALKLGNRPRFEINNIIHPECIEIDRDFEKKHIRLRLFYGKSWFILILEFWTIKIFKPIYRVFLKPMIKIWNKD
jgi:hypothetical protein